MTPFYEEAGIRIFCGDNREVLPELGRYDLCLTDPPYGIQRDKGMGGKGFDGFGKGIVRQPQQYAEVWDAERPPNLEKALNSAEVAIIWGGNYFSDYLPQSKKWLVWDKEQTMPSYSDCELAWTSLAGNSVKMFRYSGNGLMAREKDRWHPTQKPLALMKWCLSLVPTAKTVVDPYMGSGTTLRACKDLGLACDGIELSEKYCEIAANRLRQSVLEFA